MKPSVSEIYDLFNLLYNNLANEAAPNIDDFSMSLLLTKAQEEVVYNHIQALGNKYQQGAEASNKRSLELAPLLLQTNLPLTSVTSQPMYHSQGFFITNYNVDTYIKVLNETVRINAEQRDGTYKYCHRQIVPISYGEFEKLCSKPGTEPLKNQIWKVGIQNDCLFVFNKHDINNFLTKPAGSLQTYNNIDVAIRGYKIPTPIIVNDLTNTALNIGGQTMETDFELPLLKREIVQRAVEIAKGTYSTDDAGNVQLQNQLTLGQRSE